MQKLLLRVVGLITGRYLRVKTQGVPCTHYRELMFPKEGGEICDEQIPQVIVIMQLRKYLSGGILRDTLLRTTHHTNLKTSPKLFDDFE